MGRNRILDPRTKELLGMVARGNLLDTDQQIAMVAVKLAALAYLVWLLW
jgi:hypothetical protein